MPIANGAEYIESLRGRDIKVYLFGELVKEPVDHPMIRPSINAVAETYDIANSEPEIGSSHSSLTDRKVNRFLHIAESAQDLPAVQVGDQFQEKKLLEACLEVIQTGAVVGMQDMGAAGIICSTSS